MQAEQHLVFICPTHGANASLVFKAGEVARCGICHQELQERAVTLPGTETIEQKIESLTAKGSSLHIFWDQHRSPFLPWYAQLTGSRLYCGYGATCEAALDNVFIIWSASHPAPAQEREE